MSVLGRYIMRMFLVRLAVVVSAVAGFGLLFDLLENGDSVVRGAGAYRWPLLTYSLLQLPVIVSEMLTLAALVAAILAVGDLLRHRELVIIWNGGVSPLGVIGRMLPVGLLLVVAKFGLDDRLVPYTSGVLRAWAVGAYKHPLDAPGLADSVWFVSGDDVVRLPKPAAVQGRVEAITVFRRDVAGLLVERLDAARADPAAGGWELRDVTRRTIGAGKTEQLDELLWKGSIPLDEIALLAREPRELSAAQLTEVIANNAFAIRSTDAYATWLQVRYSNAIVPFLFVVLAFGLARRFSRTGTFVPVFIRGISAGFAFHIVQGLIVALGEVGLVAPLLAAWGLPVGLAICVLAPPVLAELRYGFARPRPA